MNQNSHLVQAWGRIRAIELRGQRVMLDADLAIAFGSETKRINEAVARNPAKFDDRHLFRLTEQEWADLKSHSAASSSGWGGRRKLPFVFNARGVARLGTVLTTPKALELADLIIDTFLSVQQQIASGNTRVVIANPSRYRPNEDAEAHRSFRRKLNAALSNLLDTVIDVQEHKTVHETLTDSASGLLANVRARIREKGLENEKLEADTALVLAQAEKVAAETRNLDADAEGKRLDNLDKKIAIVQRLLTVQQAMEGSEIIDLLGLLNGSQPLALAAPDIDNEDPE